MSAPIIITVPNNYLALDDDSDSHAVVDQSSPSPSRKRRLDHLTWEEKMQRKKLKNRVAAQTSRDRKKAKMDEMESQIKQLVEMNERLVDEVSSLKALNERLLSENTSLRSTAAARTVGGAQGPAEGGAPVGDPRGSLAAGDDSPIADILAHLDSEEYLDTLHQLADSLLKEIDPSSTGETQNVPARVSAGGPETAPMVGTATEQLEPCESRIINKFDIDRILSQHSYAHPYIKEEQVQIKEETGEDKGDLFFANFDEANDCITIEVPSEDIEEPKLLDTDSEFNLLTNDGSGITLECDMQLLSPLSLSPKSLDENLHSPSHRSLNSDLGYESLASPLSETESMDLSDFWCESFSELFPGLA